MDRVHRVVHGGVVPHEVDDLIRVILGGLHVGGEGSSRTLKKILLIEICFTFSLQGL